MTEPPRGAQYPILRYFDSAHLPPGMGYDFAATIANLANTAADVIPPGPEVSAGLRHLLEAKDCFVRAALPAPDPQPLPQPPVKVAPSQVLDLSRWRLTLPTALPNGIAATVGPTSLTAGWNNESFYVSPGGNSVVMDVPVDGATTRNSHYPRCELRELVAGGDNASWSSTTGQHRMVVGFRVNQLPAVKGQIVTAQIHGPDDDVLQVMATADEIVIRYKGRSKYRFPVGVYTDCVVDLGAGDGHIHGSINDGPEFAIPHEQDGLYFEAGCYVQSNPQHDARTEYGQITISRLEISHT